MAGLLALEGQAEKPNERAHHAKHPEKTLQRVYSEWTAAFRGSWSLVWRCGAPQVATSGCGPCCAVRLIDRLLLYCSGVYNLACAHWPCDCTHYLASTYAACYSQLVPSDGKFSVLAQLQGLHAAAEAADGDGSVWQIRPLYSVRSNLYGNYTPGADYCVVAFDWPRDVVSLREQTAKKGLGRSGWPKHPTPAVSNPVNLSVGVGGALVGLNCIEICATQHDAR